MKNKMFFVMLLVLSILYVQQAAAQKETHKEYRESPISECNSCHKSEGIAPNHDSDWIRYHRIIAEKPANNCGECHTQDYCLDCHKGGGIGADFRAEGSRRDFAPKSHRSDFISIHPIMAAKNPQTCYRCHEQKQCTECHDRFPKGSLHIKSHLPSGTGQTFIWSSDHSTEARRNLQSCQVCHPEGDVCLRCHSASSGARINPHPRNFKGGNISSRTNKTCKVCH